MFRRKVKSTSKKIQTFWAIKNSRNRLIPETLATKLAISEYKFNQLHLGPDSWEEARKIGYKKASYKLLPVNSGKEREILWVLKNFLSGIFYTTASKTRQETLIKAESVLKEIYPELRNINQDQKDFLEFMKYKGYEIVKIYVHEL